MDRAHLRTLLAALEPIDALEAAHRERMLALVDAEHNAFSREHYTPGHVTASAFIVSPARDAILLIFHGKLERWLQPGGHIEEHDADVVSSARREVAEEVGLHDLPLAHPGVFDVDIHEIPVRSSEPAHQHFDVRFLFEAQELPVRAGSDAKSARWVSVHELLASAVSSADATALPTDESVLRAVRKLRDARG
jgi:8-oxo-dGTP pyrophosphatase MutT (NUDIX family)